MERIGAPSIRQKALRLPPSSRTATFSATPSFPAFATASSTIFCASSEEILCFVITFAIGLLPPLEMHRALIGYGSQHRILARSRSMQRVWELISASGFTAIDIEDMAGDERSFVRRDEYDRVGKLLGAAEAADRNTRHQSGLV